MGLNQFSGTNPGLLYSRRTAIPALRNRVLKELRNRRTTRGTTLLPEESTVGVGDQATECLSWSSSGVLEAHLARKYGKLAG
uniref:GG13107 n=1 Tax=Drosophila erecta TaxID=7220 RepID=B3NYK1_DROER